MRSLLPRSSVIIYPYMAQNLQPHRSDFNYSRQIYKSIECSRSTVLSLHSKISHDASLDRKTPWTSVRLQNTDDMAQNSSTRPQQDYCGVLLSGISPALDCLGLYKYHVVHDQPFLVQISQSIVHQEIRPRIRDVYTVQDIIKLRYIQ